MATRKAYRHTCARSAKTHTPEFHRRKRRRTWIPVPVDPLEQMALVLADQLRFLRDAYDLLLDAIDELTVE